MNPTSYLCSTPRPVRSETVDSASVGLTLYQLSYAQLVATRQDSNLRPSECGEEIRVFITT